MFTSLRLKQFKSFKDTELKLGPFTVLIGANAAGKSNIRDAFRFLHGIGRGYSLAEILGEKYGEGRGTGLDGNPRGDSGNRVCPCPRFRIGSTEAPEFTVRLASSICEVAGAGRA